MSSGITHMDRNKLQKKSRSIMLGTENYDNTCFRIHIYKHRKHGNLHVSKKKRLTNVLLFLCKGMPLRCLTFSMGSNDYWYSFHSGREMSLISFISTRAFLIITNHAFDVTCAIYKITHARAPLHVSGDQICISLTCLVN